MPNDLLQPVIDIFAGADGRDWDRVRAAMAPFVRLDYTSLSGGTPQTQTPEEIVGAWSAFLPGFGKTHHQLYDFQAEPGRVRFSGKADHFIGAEVWTVEGAYEAELSSVDERWVVTALAFHLDHQSGNTDLPAQAIKRLQQ